MADKPLVRLIGCTRFFGVPEELLGNGKLPEQDQGSDGARLIECAGRTCYDSFGRGRGSEAYHNNILEVGHGSVLEHVSLTFFISGISRGCSHELVRHRVGTAYSQRSTRYVDESESDWCWHPLMHKDSPQANDAKVLCQKAYRSLVTQIQGVLEAAGVERTTACKQARGAARGVLGNALETEMVFSANVRALRHIIEMRASQYADAEIRLLANRLLEEADRIVPEYFSDYEKTACSDGIGFAVTTPHRKV